MRIRRPLTVALLGLLVATWTTGCGADADAGSENDAATVVAVLDGRTVEVEQGGKATIVTLLGIDAPAPDECLGEDAAAALADLLPIGAEVRLEPAGEDRAAVVADEVLVNAELARLGLAHALAGTTISEQVLTGEQEAVEAAVGLFGTQDECTLPAQVAALEEGAGSAADEAAVLVAGVGVDEVDRHARAVAAAAAAGAAVAALLDGNQSARYPAALVADLRSRTAAVNERLLGTTSAVELVRASEVQRVETERVAAEAAAVAAAQAAADEAARQAQAAADAEAARIAAEAAATTKAPATSVYYQNCDAVRAAGAAPILAGQPGYSSKLDRDGDGVGCEN
ncbi:excalibur calcium-binding domain-containing protein [Cellulomonas sp. P5_C5]